MKLLIAISVYCIVLQVDSQTFQTVTPNYRATVINPDTIYFDDNRPSATNINKLTNQQNIATTKKDNAYDASQDTYVNKVNLRPNIRQMNVNGVPGQVQPIMPQYDDDNSELAATNFGIQLFKILVMNNPENTVISPFSVTTLLALLQQGASGITLDQISSALQLTPAKSAELFQNVGQILKNRSSRNILKMVNNVVVSDTFSLNPNFEQTALRNFGSDVTSTSFARPDLAVQRINLWVATVTDNKIPNFLAQEAVTDTTQLVLVNAVYFKGLWQIPFRVALTRLQYFRVSTGVAKMTPFMNARRYFKAGVDPNSNAKVVILPFEKDQYSLMIILPSELLSVDNLISSLTVDQLQAYQNFKAMDVEISLPKFTIRADTDLVPVFNKIGISNILSDRAELFGLGSSGQYSPRVSTAVHSAVFSIDEEGGTAAAATAFAAVALSNDDPAAVIKINRPFLAVLWDNETKLPLFFAKIEDPTT